MVSTTSAPKALPKPNLGKLTHLLAFGFGAGCSPRAPGTMGTLLAVGIYLPLSRLPWSVYLAVLVAVIVAGLTSEAQLAAYAAAKGFSAEQTQELLNQPMGRRIAQAFGNTCAKIGLLIALAAIIGRCLLDSGGAYDTATGLWTIGDLANGQVAALNITVVVTPEASRVVSLGSTDEIVEDLVGLSNVPGLAPIVVGRLELTDRPHRADRTTGGPVPDLNERVAVDRK